MKSSRIILLLMVLAMFFAANGCQAAPETAAVTSKNDGAFEAALEKTAEDVVTDNDEQTNGSEVYINSFTSSDGNILYTVDVQIPDVTGAVPLVQVTPKEITAAEAQHIAEVLFDGADMFEYTEELSKSELEEEILSLRQRLSDYNTLLEHYGGDKDMTDYMISQMEVCLEEYEAAYASADETLEPQLCAWEFYPESHYLDLSTSDSLYIMTTTNVDGWPYQYKVCNRNEADYRIHSIFAFIDETRIAMDDIYSLEKPSQEDLDDIYTQVRETLDSIGLTDWYIYSCEVTKRYLSNGRTGYGVMVKAFPTYEGIKVVPQEQIMNLKSDDDYASNYYYETIEFDFTDGKLTFFEYQAPLETVSVINNDVQILPVDEITSAFETQMKLDDITGYQIPGIPDEVAGTEQISRVEATVDTVEFGLTRIRIKNNESDFYLTPAYTFKGTYVSYDGAGEPRMGLDTAFITINAVDGSIINTALGY